MWEIPAGRMKMRKAHRVPLAPRVVSVLKELHKSTGQSRFLFPSVRSVARCMSENTLNAALRRMGFRNEDMTSHGFRASASSMLNESGSGTRTQSKGSWHMSTAIVSGGLRSCRILGPAGQDDDMVGESLRRIAPRRRGTLNCGLYRVR